MKDPTILRTGVVGSVVAAVCCFTPVLVILLGAVGLSAWLGWLDYVLFPALALFLGITAYGLWRRQQTTASGTPPARSEEHTSELQSLMRNSYAGLCLQKKTHIKS